MSADDRAQAQPPRPRLTKAELVDLQDAMGQIEDLIEVAHGEYSEAVTPLEQADYTREDLRAALKVVTKYRARCKRRGWS